MQLSDPSEYEGGDLLLHTGDEPIVINKQKGMLVMFPSYTLHEVTPVTKGERYSLVAWVHGPKLR
jgi:PKHD-type hydroxylase